jgi:GT2 family glycosyltransferase
VRPVSVIIPVYRGRDVIGNCLDSFPTASSEFQIEVIVIDDCSPDGAGELVKSRYPEVKLLTNETNRGYAASVNRGLEIAEGDFILLLNQDTATMPGAVESLVNELEQDAGLAAAAPQLMHPNGSIQPSCRSFPTYVDVVYHHLLLPYIFPRSRVFSHWKMGWFSHDRRAEVDQPSFSAIMLRRDTVRSVGLLDERFRIFFNDVDYCKRILDGGGRILFCPNAKVTHLGGHAVKKLPVRRIIHSYAGFIRFFFKHKQGVKYAVQNLLIALLLTISAVPRIVWNILYRLFTSAKPSF